MLPPNTQESCHGQSERISSIIHAEGVRGMFINQSLTACR
jgi:hypothetical protein